MPSTNTGRRKRPAATAAMRRSISSRDGATSNTVRSSATWLVTVCIRSLPNGTPVRSRKSAWAVSYGHFGDQLRRGLLHIELFAPCHQAQRVVEGIARPRDKPDNRNRAAQAAPAPPWFRRCGRRALGPSTPHHTCGQVTCCAVVFTTVDMRHDRLGEAPGELLAQVPHRGGHLR